MKYEKYLFTVNYKTHTRTKLAIYDDDLWFCLICPVVTINEEQAVKHFTYKHLLIEDGE